MGSDMMLWHLLTKQTLMEDETYLKEDAQHVLRWLLAQGVVFEGRSVLDIGCGSGALSIPILAQGANVTMLDLSAKMLQYVQEKMIEGDVTLWHDNWHTSSSEQRYDIVIASMTPAIKHEAHLEKMIRSTRSIGIFVGWKDYRVNSFLDHLLLAHHAEESSSKESMDVKTFLKELEKRSISYNVHYFQTAWQRTFTYQEAVEYAKRQLLGRHIFPDQRKIDAIWQDEQRQGVLHATSRAQKGVVVFSKCPLLKEMSLVCV
jgi:2-polyprenyl-3-methyl-5-hydroxy-6-metoxy-1,4-benzoquinol methylase